MGERGERGTESLGGTVRGGRRTLGLLGIGGGRGWEGVEGVDGSDFAADGVAVVSGSGLDLVACRGLSATLGLAGRVWVLLLY